MAPGIRHMKGGGVRCLLHESVFETRTMCVSCHLDSVEEPRTEGPRMTDEMGDTWRRTGTVDFS